MGVGGQLLQRVTDGYALALYPHIEGRSSAWGDHAPLSERLAITELIVTLHGSPESVTRGAPTDDYLIPQRDELRDALDDLPGPWEQGPLSESARQMLGDHADDLKRLLARYDRLVDEARGHPDRLVLTHGEPHLANLIRTDAGWVLVDWDTAKMGPTRTRPVDARFRRRGRDGVILGGHRSTGAPVHA